MRSLLTSIVLCLVAHTAVAQCVPAAASAPTPAARVQPGSALIRTAGAGTREVRMMTAADTRDARVMQRGAPVVRQAKAEVADADEHPAAMLLAALALMSAIALRRTSGSGP